MNLPIQSYHTAVFLVSCQTLEGHFLSSLLLSRAAVLGGRGLLWKKRVRSKSRLAKAVEKRDTEKR